MCVWIIKASRNINMDRRIGDLNNRRSAAARVKPSVEIRPAFAPTQLQYIFRRFLDPAPRKSAAEKCEILYEHSNYSFSFEINHKMLNYAFYPIKNLEVNFV